MLRNHRVQAKKRDFNSAREAEMAYYDQQKAALADAEAGKRKPWKPDVTVAVMTSLRSLDFKD